MLPKCRSEREQSGRRELRMHAEDKPREKIIASARHFSQRRIVMQKHACRGASPIPRPAYVKVLTILPQHAEMPPRYAAAILVMSHAGRFHTRAVQP